MSLKNWFRRHLLRLVLCLPDDLLVRMSGGERVAVQGDVLDARIQYLAHIAKSRPPIQELPITRGRAGFDAALYMVDQTPLRDGLQVKDSHFKTQKGDIRPCRIYSSEVQNPSQPLLVWYHMGGGVLGGLETAHSFLTRLCVRAQTPIISVDYRLAPEYPFPAGLEDAQEAYQWALGQSERLGAPKGRAAIGGGSAGGNFAAIIAQETVRLGLPRPDYQLLVYPALDFTLTTESRKSHAQSYPLNMNMALWMGKLYAPEGDYADTRLSPGLETELSELPPAYIYTAGFDLLRDEAKHYARRLTAQGVPVLTRNYASLCHGFTAYAGVCPAACAANEQIYRDISDATLHS